MSSLWTGHPAGAPPRRSGERALVVLSAPLTIVSAGFTFYVTLLEVPGGLASWSLTVLAFALWLWPVMPLVRRWRWSRTSFELTETAARARHRAHDKTYREFKRSDWPKLTLSQEADGSWTAWPTNPHGERSCEPVFEGLADPEPLRSALSAWEASSQETTLLPQSDRVTPVS